MLFSLLLAISIVVGEKVVFESWVGYPLDRNYFTAVTPVDALWVAALTALFTVAVSWMPDVVSFARPLVQSGRSHQDRPGDTRWFLGTAAVLAACWLPFVLTYAPGLVVGDSMSSVRMALGISERWSNHHPVLYTLFVKSTMMLGVELHGVNAGVFIYTLVQYLLMVSAYAVVILWLKRKGVSRGVLVVAVCYYALVPIFPMYAVTMWKDPLFGTMIVLLSILVFEAIRSKGATLRSTHNLVLFTALSLAIVFFRNNGFLIVAGTGFALIAVLRGSPRRFTVTFTSAMVLALLIQGPVFDALNVEKPFVEAVGVPLQQMAYVKVTGGTISPQEDEFLDNLLPRDLWPSTYAPCIVDSIKWHDEFDEAYLERNQRRFLATWASLLKKNPEAFVKAYILNTFGHWKIGAKNNCEFVKTEIAENSLGIRSVDLVERATGYSLMPLFAKMRGPDGTNGYVSNGLIVWITLLSATTVALMGRGRYVVVLLPYVLGWLTLLVATPVAFGLRYLFMIVAGLPLILLLPLIIPNNEPTE